VLYGPKPYQKWLYQNPQHQRTKYYNSILPAIYEEAYPSLQTKFESYLFKERSWRYVLHTWKKDIELKLNSKLDATNFAAYGKFVSETFTSINPEHKRQCSEGVQKIQPLLDEVEEKKEELKVARGELYVGNTLKPSMAEKDHFLKVIISELESLFERCGEALAGMKNTLARLEMVTKGLTQPKTAHLKSRNKKNSKTKAKTRKRKRLEKRMNMILTKLGYDDINNSIQIEKIDKRFLAGLHKRYDRSPLQELMKKNAFVNEAAREVQFFLKKCNESESDTSETESEDEEDEEDNA
jgi:predicted transcriptional regulator